MALFVVSPKPAGLLALIKTAIDDGHIDTWAYDGDGDFTHTASSGQWKNQAWLRPHVSPDLLQFGIVGRKGVTLIKEVYAIFHGRFIEMLLAHFDVEFSLAQTTALLHPPDLYK
jgi:hypothetical protein